MQRHCHTGRLVLERDRFINLQPYTLTFENAQHITLFAGEEGGSFYSVRVARAGFDQGAKLAVKRASAANTLRWIPGTSTRHAFGPPLSVNDSACFESFSNDFRSAASSRGATAAVWGACELSVLMMGAAFESLGPGAATGGGV